MSQPPTGPTPPQPEEPAQGPGQPGAVPPPPGGAFPPPPVAPTPPPAQTPPPAGGYPPPPGSYEPPAAAYPPPSSAYPPPAASYPPPAGGYGQPAGTGVDIGQSFSYGWAKLWQTPGPFLVAGLIYILGLGIIISIFYFLLLAGASVGTHVDAYGNVTSGGLAAFSGFTSLLFVGIIVVFVYLMQAGFIRAGLDVTYGRPVTVGTFFSFGDFGRIVVAALLTGAIVGVGSVLCYVPGIVAAFFLQFTLFFVIDKGLGAIDALKASFALVKDNVGPAILLYLVVLAIGVVSELACGIGVIAGLPLTFLVSAHLYRTLLREPVAP